MLRPWARRFSGRLAHSWPEDRRFEEPPASFTGWGGSLILGLSPIGLWQAMTELSETALMIPMRRIECSMHHHNDWVVSSKRWPDSESIPSSVSN